MISATRTRRTSCTSSSMSCRMESWARHTSFSMRVPQAGQPNWRNWASSSTMKKRSYINLEDCRPEGEAGEPTIWR
jgi:hypothetical protein